MISLSKTLKRALPVLLVGALAVTAVADAHPRHKGHHRKHPRSHRVVVDPGPVCAVPRVVHRPYRPHRPARVVYRGTPFTYQADLGVYLSGVSLGVRFGNVAPAGYVYADPWCGAEFVSVRAYQRHVHRHDHPAYLSVVSRGGACRHEDWSD